MTFVCVNEKQFILTEQGQRERASDRKGYLI
jgi:hypothetical protein